MLLEPPVVPDMSAPGALGSAQPDALSFLDHPVSDLDRLLQEQVPLGTCGSLGLDTLPALQYAPASTCALPDSSFKVGGSTAGSSSLPSMTVSEKSGNYARSPGIAPCASQDAGMYGDYSSPALQAGFMGHLVAPLTAQHAAGLDHSRSWSQENYNSMHSSWTQDTYNNALRSSSYDAVYRQQPAPEVDAASAADLDRHSSGARSGSSGHDSLQVTRRAVCRRLPCSSATTCRGFAARTVGAIMWFPDAAGPVDMGVTHARWTRPGGEPPRVCHCRARWGV